MILVPQIKTLLFALFFASGLSAFCFVEVAARSNQLCDSVESLVEQVRENIDISRVQDLIEELSRLSDAKPPAVTRILYTARDVEAREFLRSLIKNASLQLHEDPVGNIYARYDPLGTLAKSNGLVGTGSHFDAIPLSGKYDGVVGVIGGIEALRALKDSEFKPKRPLEVIAFTSEEPTRFGISCIGSRTLVGEMTANTLRSLNDGDGISFDKARSSAGYDDSLENVVLPDNYYSAFVELHIEQGRTLEETTNDIGVVTAIAGPAAGDAFFEGPGGHAGAVLMNDRRDALLAGAEFALAVETAARNTGSEDSVATCGVFSVEPGAENSIGRRVAVSVDARDTDLKRRDGMIKAALDAAKNIGIRRNVDSRFTLRTSDSPAKCSDQITSVVRKVSEKLGFAHTDIVSRAYHDSLFMARKFPTGMIFIPCRKGVSHHWTEFSSPEQIRKGILTLALTLAELAESSDPMLGRDEL